NPTIKRSATFIIPPLVREPIEKLTPLSCSRTQPQRLQICSFTRWLLQTCNQQRTVQRHLAGAHLLNKFSLT
ncbi:MAG: hypothetical protein KDJ27_07575, partial [Gammaproteobacteria bacterium]|nr:hypothetical protein [Gammaproteobacteria bacterium]